MNTLRPTSGGGRAQGRTANRRSRRARGLMNSLRSRSGAMFTDREIEARESRPSLRSRSGALVTRKEEKDEAQRRQQQLRAWRIRNTRRATRRATQR